MVNGLVQRIMKGLKQIYRINRPIGLEILCMFQSKLPMFYGDFITQIHPNKGKPLSISNCEPAPVPEHNKLRSATI